MSVVRLKRTLSCPQRDLTRGTSAVPSYHLLLSLSSSERSTFGKITQQSPKQQNKRTKTPVFPLLPLPARCPTGPSLYLRPLFRLTGPVCDTPTPTPFLPEEGGRPRLPRGSQGRYRVPGPFVIDVFGSTVSESGVTIQ